MWGKLGEGGIWHVQTGGHPAGQLIWPPSQTRISPSYISTLQTKFSYAEKNFEINLKKYSFGKLRKKNPITYLKKSITPITYNICVGGEKLRFLPSPSLSLI